MATKNPNPSSGAKMDSIPKTPPPKAATSAPSSGLDPQVVGIVVAIIVVLITIVLFFLRGKRKGRTVLLIGPTESGKTSIFSQLWQGKAVDTVTSVELNEGEYVPNSRPALLLKDIPGNDRVRQKFWDENKGGVRGIIVVVDAAGGSKAIRDAADVLYWVLTDSVVTSVRPDVLIFANKQDLPTAKGIRVIRTALEREITTLRLTRSASLQTTGGSSSAPAKSLGRPDKDFDFDQLLPLKVEFAEGVGNAEKSEDMKKIKDWLEKIA